MDTQLQPQLPAVWDLPDPASYFPHGSSWALDRGNLKRWAQHQFAARFRNLGIICRASALDGDELFILRLDLIQYRSLYERHCHGWLPFLPAPDDPHAGIRRIKAERLRKSFALSDAGPWEHGLAHYLRPGREEWGLYFLDEEELEDWHDLG